MSTKVYQYNLQGYYVGETIAYSGLLPANTTAVEPVFESGFWPVWNGTVWLNVEDNRQTPYWLPNDSHKAKARYMLELGPLPYDALLEQPVPSTEELAQQVRTERNARITACDWMIARHRDEIDGGDVTTLTTAEYAAWLAYRKALRDLPSEDGFPWDDGEQETPWPEEPAKNNIVESDDATSEAVS